MILIDQLFEKLKNLEPHIKVIQNYWDSANLEEVLKKLTLESEDTKFWINQQSGKILKELQKIKRTVLTYQTIIKSYQELPELIALFENDPTELTKLDIDINKLTKQTLAFKIELLLQEEYDESSCFLSINAGAGGTESQDWADMLLRMYVRFCEQNNLEVSIVEYQGGEEAGIKSATLYIKGDTAYGLLRTEHGVHRLVRISPFDANKRRHTSFAAVTVIPELPASEKIEIDPKDLRIDTYRAGGAGGQHVNKTESAVRITHIPTNIVVQCQSERSQIQNRETAMKMLMAKLKQKQIEEDKSKTAVEKKKAEWGSQIRSYILHPYKMVKDHRTDIEHFQPELVLDGDLMKFIESYLVQEGTQK
ncbi:peptide chain release factor 2 [Candidatus Dependentiae bacterium]|nr:peptide chain release factor 2 [Candidatus Dependentiae bacterium]